MSEQEIFNQLLEILESSVDNPNLDLASITMDTDIYEEIGVSSISAIYMALEIETRFGFSISNEEASNLHKVKDLVTLIKSKAH